LEARLNHASEKTRRKTYEKVDGREFPMGLMQVNGKKGKVAERVFIYRIEWRQ
jgi:hypothetical protein